MSNKKKTAVDSIIEFCQELLGNHYSISHDGVCSAVIEFCQKQAKEMEMEQNKITENTSDGYHTFKELYEIRKAYNVALFNEWGKFDIPSYNVHKSWKHHDGEFCFGGGWFIVVAIMPTGQISNHYKAEDWDLFKIPEVEKALFPFDGHTTEDVIYRLINFLGLK